MFTVIEGRWGHGNEITDSRSRLWTSAAFVFIPSIRLPFALRGLTHRRQITVVGRSLFNAVSVCCYGTNTFIEQMDPLSLDGDAEVVFAVDSLDLVEGTYKLDVAVHTCDGYPYDYHRLLYTFRVKSRTPDVGIYRPKHRWTFSGGVRFKEGHGRDRTGLAIAPGRSSASRPLDHSPMFTKRRGARH